MSNYVIWKFDDYPGSCVLKDLTGLEATYRLNNGTPLASDFPSGVSLHMNPDFPDDLALGDSLLNSDMIVVGSARLRDLLVARSIPNLEFLPVTIVDHKGLVASRDYFIVHPTAPVDCFDRNTSVYEEDILDPDSIGSISKLVLSEAAVPTDLQIFNMAGYWDLTFVRRDLADALADAGFSGIRFIELSDHPES